MELSEASTRVYVNRGGKIKRVYRCPAGFRKGKAVNNPGMCFAPRQKASTRMKHRIAAKKTKAVRIRKTRIANRKAMHFRLKRLNNTLRGRR